MLMDGWRRVKAFVAGIRRNPSRHPHARAKIRLTSSAPKFRQAASSCAGAITYKPMGRLLTPRAPGTLSAGVPSNVNARLKVDPQCLESGEDLGKSGPVHAVASLGNIDEIHGASQCRHAPEPVKAPRRCDLVVQVGSILNRKRPAIPFLNPAA